MSVYIDHLMNCLVSRNWRWPQACHMWADTEQELHAFAASIGLRWEWFQNPKGFKHYDLNPSRRAKAVAKGAIELDRRATVESWERLGFRRRRRTLSASGAIASSEGGKA